MELSHGELMVMEMLWDGECLDDNGEIQALELSKLLYKKYGMGKTTEIFNQKIHHWSCFRYDWSVLSWDCDERTKCQCR